MAKPKDSSFDELIGGGTSVCYVQFNETEFEAIIQKIETAFKINLKRSPDVLAVLNEHCHSFSGYSASQFG
jgi:hypothetical protein